jgi:hypothetical protein
MRDAIGNKMCNDDLVRWELLPGTTRLTGQIVNVQDGGFVEGRGDLPTLIQILITIPVKVDDFTHEPILSDFFCLRNPRSEALLDALSNTHGGNKPS